MSDVGESRGRCLCGAVQVVAKQASNSVGACHCKMCRRWSSGPFMEVDCGTDVTVEGEKHITLFSSSDWAERGFCAKCGTNLFYRLKENGQYIMSVGIFDDSEGRTFDSQVFIDEKPSFYDFSNKTTNMTGAEVFAKYAPKE